MASPRSGISILMVRVEGKPPEPLPRGPIVVRDETPWVDLLFSTALDKDRRKVLESRSRGSLVQQSSSRDASSTSVWMRWWLWEENKHGQRRRGQFKLGGGDTGLPTVRAYATPGRIASPAEHQRMVDDISAALQGATWDTLAPQQGVWVQQTIGRVSVAELIERASAELVLARSLARSPAVELAPVQPGRSALPGAPQLCQTSELPENHLVGWWATHRQRQLHLAERDTKAQIDVRLSRRAALSEAGAQSRSHEIDESVRQAHDQLARLQSLARRLSPYVRTEPPRLREVGPAVTRDPRRRKLLDALRSYVDTPTLAVTNMLSRLRELQFHALFELWAAVAVCKTLVALGWALETTPSVRWLDEWSRERVIWSFSSNGDNLEFICEPHVDLKPLAKQQVSGPLLDPMQRASAALGAHEEGLMAVHQVASPDYVMIFRRGDDIAFTVGDAIASDFKHARDGRGGQSVADKIKKVAVDYPRNIFWRSKEQIARCSAVAAFVLVPGDGQGWTKLEKVGQELQRGFGLLLGATLMPTDPNLPLDVQGVAQIVETLRAHARDGSHRTPVAPGTPS